MSKGFLYDTGDELITREDVNEVPDGSTSSAGDVLSLDSNKKPKWSTPESGLPDTTSASQGDVLSLDDDKEPVWSPPSGGGGGTVIMTIDKTATPTNIGGVDFYPLMDDNNWVPITYDEVWSNPTQYVFAYNDSAGGHNYTNFFTVAQFDNQPGTQGTINFFDPSNQFTAPMALRIDPSLNLIACDPITK